MLKRRTFLSAALPVALAACDKVTRTASLGPALIHRYAPPRPAANVEHAIVYRREDEFCAWTYTRGFWETAHGDLIQNFDALTVAYEDPNFINHNNIFANSTGTKVLTVRSTDRGRTWNGENPEVNVQAAGGPTAKPFAEIVRDDGGSWDLGYPNAWEVEPGKIGCIYYFNSKNDPLQVNGDKRHIARSIFSV